MNGAAGCLAGEKIETYTECAQAADYVGAGAPDSSSSNAKPEGCSWDEVTGKAHWNPVWNPSLGEGVDYRDIILAPEQSTGRPSTPVVCGDFLSTHSCADFGTSSDNTYCPAGLRMFDGSDNPGTTPAEKATNCANRCLVKHPPRNAEATAWDTFVATSFNINKDGRCYCLADCDNPQTDPNYSRYQLTDDTDWEIYDSSVNTKAGCLTECNKHTEPGCCYWTTNTATPSCRWKPDGTAQTAAQTVYTPEFGTSSDHTYCPGGLRMFDGGDGVDKAGVPHKGTPAKCAERCLTKYTPINGNDTSWDTFVTTGFNIKEVGDQIGRCYCLGDCDNPKTDSNYSRYQLTDNSSDADPTKQFAVTCTTAEEASPVLACGNDWTQSLTLADCKKAAQNLQLDNNYEPYVQEVNNPGNNEPRAQGCFWMDTGDVKRIVFNETARGTPQEQRDYITDMNLRPFCADSLTGSTTNNNLTPLCRTPTPAPTHAPCSSAAEYELPADTYVVQPNATCSATGDTVVTKSYTEAATVDACQA